MALTSDDLKKIKTVMHGVAEEVAEKHTNELAIILAKTFDDQEKRLNGNFASIDEHFAKINETLAQHTQMHQNHTMRLDRIEQRQRAEQDLLDRHDVRVSKIEKHLKLKPAM